MDRVRDRFRDRSLHTATVLSLNINQGATCKVSLLPQRHQLSPASAAAITEGIITKNLFINIIHCVILHPFFPSVLCASWSSAGSLVFEIYFIDRSFPFFNLFYHFNTWLHAVSSYWVLPWARCVTSVSSSCSPSHSDRILICLAQPAVWQCVLIT